VTGLNLAAGNVESGKERLRCHGACTHD
jgi:hypothetical protein